MQYRKEKYEKSTMATAVYANESGKRGPRKRWKAIESGKSGQKSIEMQMRAEKEDRHAHD
jgi:hypothetical protein